MSPHRIRLPAPWQTIHRQLPEGCEVNYQRSFQRPSGLAEESRVALELELLEPLSFSVLLNGTSCFVQQLESLRFEVLLETVHLQPTNKLDVVIKLQSAVDLERMPQTSAELSVGRHYLKSVALRIE